MLGRHPAHATVHPNKEASHWSHPTAEHSLQPHPTVKTGQRCQAVAGSHAVHPTAFLGGKQVGSLTQLPSLAYSQPDQEVWPGI